MNEYIRPLGHKQLMISGKKILLDDHWRQVIEGLENWVWRMGGTQGNSRGQISRDKEILIIIHIFASLPWDSQDGENVPLTKSVSHAHLHTFGLFTPRTGWDEVHPTLSACESGGWELGAGTTSHQDYIHSGKAIPWKETNMKGNQMCPTIKKVTNVYYEWNFAEKETMWF